VFTLHGVDERGRPVLRENLTRARFERFLGKASPSEVVLEACGSSHHWDDSRRNWATRCG
jgi:transposase